MAEQQDPPGAGARDAREQVRRVVGGRAVRALDGGAVGQQRGARPRRTLRAGDVARRRGDADERLELARRARGDALRLLGDPGVHTVEPMPELPEVDATARLLGRRGARRSRRVDAGARGQRDEDVRPAAARARGAIIDGVTPSRQAALRRTSTAGVVLLVHLMNAGRLQLFEKRASLKDRTSRLLLRLDGDRELRLREFGTRQAAWAKVYRAEDVDVRRAPRRPRARRPGPTHRPCATACPAPARCTPSCATRRSSPASAAPGSTTSSGPPSSPPSSAATTSPTPRHDALDAAIRTELVPRRRPLRRALVAPAPGQAGQGRPHPQPPGRALPPLRHRPRGRLLRGLRHDLLPDRPDRRPGVEGPSFESFVEVTPKIRHVCVWIGH